ncbi:hypothetical protein BBP40_001585 [Aspergillus hancockii]|nr:hypothetical protein BBP40_001585 [Aspergillus hancockii]
MIFVSATLLSCAPRDGEGGVLGNDFGKAVQGQGFQQTRARYKRKGHQLEEAMKSTLDKHAKLRPEMSDHSQARTDCAKSVLFTA